MTPQYFFCQNYFTYYLVKLFIVILWRIFALIITFLTMASSSSSHHHWSTKSPFSLQPLFMDKWKIKKLLLLLMDFCLDHLLVDSHQWTTTTIWFFWTHLMYLLIVATGGKGHRIKLISCQSIIWFKVIQLWQIWVRDIMY